MAAGCTDAEEPADTAQPVACSPGQWGETVTDPDTIGCAPTIREYTVCVPAQHVKDPVAYVSVPPCVGDHFGKWSSWGEVSTELEPEYYVHNLEHGGVALLYDCPDGCDDIVTALRDYAKAVPEDDGGAFRYILSPNSALDSQIAVAAWGWTWTADCLDMDSLKAFVAAHYRKAPEDVAFGGAHDPDATE